MNVVKKTKLALNINGSKIICEEYGNKKTAKNILLFCHGFPGSSRLDRLRNNLNDMPILVVEMNYRGDKKCEGEFSFLGSIEDIIAVVKYLKNLYNVPIHSLGYSMGGFYIANIAKEYPHFFDKVILLNPVVNTKALFSNTPIMDDLWGQAKNILSLKSSEIYEEELKKINSKYNPMDFVKKLKNSFTIIQGTADKILEPENAKKFYNLLNCKKSYYEILNAKHDLLGDEKELINTIQEI